MLVTSSKKLVTSAKFLVALVTSESQYWALVTQLYSSIYLNFVVGARLAGCIVNLKKSEHLIKKDGYSSVKQSFLTIENQKISIGYSQLWFFLA